MAEEKPRPYAIYAALPPEYGDFLEKLKEIGLDKADVVKMGLDMLMELSFEEFLKRTLVPKAKAIDLSAFFKGGKA